MERSETPRWRRMAADGGWRMTDGKMRMIKYGWKNADEKIRKQRKLEKVTIK